MRIVVQGTRSSIDISLTDLILAAVSNKVVVQIALHFAHEQKVID